MAYFNLPNTTPPCPVQLPDDLTQDQLLNFPAFKTWHKTITHTLSLQAQPNHTFHTRPYTLRSINVQSVDWFGIGPGRRLGFIKLRADIRNDDNEWLPGAVFMRGGSVGMLIVLQPNDADPNDEDEKYVLLTVQPRIAAGSLGFTEIPAGMLDDAGSFYGVAAREIEEETGLKVDASELIDMTALTLRDEIVGDAEERLPKGIVSSPGGCDEFIPIFLYEKRMPRAELHAFRGKLTGLRNEGEKITVKVVKLLDVWKEGVRDAKTLAAMALYQGLKRKGGI